MALQKGCCAEAGLDMVFTDRRLFGDGEAENSISFPRFIRRTLLILGTWIIPISWLLRHHLALEKLLLYKMLRKAFGDLAFFDL